MITCWTAWTTSSRVTVDGGLSRIPVPPSRSDHRQSRAIVYTDAYRAYEELEEAYAHEIVDHALQYVRGRVHTNGIESFWNLLKRGVKATCTHVEPEHLNRYLDKRCFTFNERESGDFGRMCVAMSGIAGRQMTYAALTAKN